MGDKGSGWTDLGHLAWEGDRLSDESMRVLAKHALWGVEYKAVFEGPLVVIHVVDANGNTIKAFLD